MTLRAASRIQNNIFCICILYSMCVTCINRLKPVWETPSYFRSPLSVKMFRNVVVNVAVQAMTEFLRECQERMISDPPVIEWTRIGLGGVFMSDMSAHICFCKFGRDERCFIPVFAK